MSRKDFSGRGGSEADEMNHAFDSIDEVMRAGKSDK